MSIILVSSEMPEILGMSDRILVMHEGRICGEYTAEEADQEKLMACAIGRGGFVSKTAQEDGRMSEVMSGQVKTVSIKDRLIEQKTLIALVVMIVIVSFLNPNFFTTGNILNILRQTAINAVMAVGMTLVILTAGIDLSVGSVLALCGAIGASLIAAQMPVIVAVGAALGAGAILGGISGIIIAKGKVQAFIATLVSMTLVRGLTLVYTDGRPISTGFTEVADAFAFIGTGYLFGIPFPIWIMAFTFGAAWYLLNHTRLGALYLRAGRK